MKKNGIALAIILIILVLTLVACGENDLGTCDHNVVIDEAVSATCTEKGLTEGAHCSKCGEVLLAQTEVPALGHTAADAVKENEIAPTCTTVGSYDSVVYCSVCDAELSREAKSVDALDHNIVNHNAQAPTCTEVGWEAYEACSRCDYTTYVEIPATGHDYKEVGITEPTCAGKGYTTYTCHCGDTYKADEVAALEHTYSDDGSCSVCGYQEYIFKLNEDGESYTITGRGEDFEGTEIVIPAEYNGKPVTTIGELAFHVCDSLTSITIPDSVTSIGYSAFRYCTSLTSITIPDGVSRIGSHAFNGCTSLTSIVIPNSVTSIGDHAFHDCTSLTSITIPDSVTTIGDGTFYGCDSLTSITIPDSVTTICDYSFTSCDSLTSVTFGENSQLTTIDWYAFSFCDSLTSVTFGENSQLTTIGASVFYKCTSLTSIVIPDSVTTIGGYAFEDCILLTSIVIPKSVTIIGDYAFYYCTSLTDVYYTGTEEQWNSITIDTGNDFLTNATRHYNYVNE